MMQSNNKLCMFKKNAPVQRLHAPVISNTGLHIPDKIINQTHRVL